jgi:hypothetical protein
MARLRRQEPEGLAPEVAHKPISPSERVDPRVVLVAPSEVQRDPEALLRYAAEHYPLAILSEAEVLARRETLARQRAWAEAKRDARKRGIPEPARSDFFPAG